MPGCQSVTKITAEIKKQTLLFVHVKDASRVIHETCNMCDWSLAVAFHAKKISLQNNGYYFYYVNLYKIINGIILISLDTAVGLLLYFQCKKKKVP